MNFIKQTIPFAATNSFSKLAVDYAAQDIFFKPFINHFPDVDSFRQQISEKQKAYEQGDRQLSRKILQQVLQQQYEGLKISESVQSNLQRLASDITFTVCTAHQPCIFTGPLYFIYKITHAIKLAKECNDLFPEYHFVPLLYLGTEDNDIQEIGSLFLDDEHLHWQTAQGGACGRMLTNDLQPITQKVLALLNENIPDEAWLKALVEEAFLTGNTLSQATRILVNALFADEGLLILDADDRQLKAAFAAIMRDELLHQRSAAWVHETNTALAKKYKVQAAGRDINLFYLGDQLRERIIRKDDRWIVNRSEVSFDETALLAELKQYPERFSPNVILRPLYQEILLPNIAFVGGGGEVAYWLELKSLFDHYAVQYPALVLRNSFLQIDQKTDQHISDLRLDPADVFLPQHLLTQKILADHNGIVELEVNLQQIERLYLQIEKLGESTAITLAKSMRAHHAKAQRINRRIMEKYRTQIKRLETQRMSKAEKIRQKLFPFGGLQERKDNFIPYFKIFGKQLFSQLIESQSGFRSEMIILTGC